MNVNLWHHLTKKKRKQGINESLSTKKVSLRGTTTTAATPRSPWGLLSLFRGEGSRCSVLEPVTSSSSSSSFTSHPVSSTSSSSSSNRSMSMSAGAMSITSSQKSSCVVHESRSIIPRAGGSCADSCSVGGVYLEEGGKHSEMPPVSAAAAASSSAVVNDYPTPQTASPVTVESSLPFHLRLIPKWLKKQYAASVISPNPNARSRNRNRNRNHRRHCHRHYRGQSDRYSTKSRKYQRSDGPLSGYEDEEERDELESVQASTHFSVTCTDTNPPPNPTVVHNSDSEEKKDLRKRVPSSKAGLRLNNNNNLKQQHAFSSSSSPSPRSSSRSSAVGALDLYFSRLKPPNASTSKSIVDIASLDGSNRSVQSDLLTLAVSFDNDYAQLILMPTEDLLNDDDDEDEATTIHGHEDDGNGEHQEELSMATDEFSGMTDTQASVDKNHHHHIIPTHEKPHNHKYSMQRTPPRNLDHRSGNTTTPRTVTPWSSNSATDADTVTNNNDDGSFQGVDEWSLAPASIIIETTHTDWDTDDNDNDSDVVWKEVDDESIKCDTSINKSTLAGHDFGLTGPTKFSQRYKQVEKTNHHPSETLSLYGSDQNEDNLSKCSVDSSDCPFDEQPLLKAQSSSVQFRYKKSVSKSPRFKGLLFDV